MATSPSVSGEHAEHNAQPPPPIPRGAEPLGQRLSGEIAVLSARPKATIRCDRRSNGSRFSAKIVCESDKILSEGARGHG
jgi:hypothetical protein